MSFISFKYGYLRDRKVPIIPLQILGLDGWHNFMAFVDSGATYSIFDKDEADRLGIEYRAGRELMIVVGDGSCIPVFIHRLKIRIGEEEIEAEIGFSERLGIGFNVLGRKGIFESFRICFDEAEGVVTFERK